MGELIDVIGLGDTGNRSKDILGRVDEDFLTPSRSSPAKESC